ncbi:MAG: hypothetical protein QXI38_03590 [Conexivisphaerales archaeon]
MTRRDHSCRLGISTTESIEQDVEEVNQVAHNGMMIGFRITSNDRQYFLAPGKAVRKRGNIGLRYLQLKEELLDSLGACLRENAVANTALCQKPCTC